MNPIKNTIKEITCLDDENNRDHFIAEDLTNHHDKQKGAVLVSKALLMKMYGSLPVGSDEEAKAKLIASIKQADGQDKVLEVLQSEIAELEFMQNLKAMRSQQIRDEYDGHDSNVHA